MNLFLEKLGDTISYMQGFGYGTNSIEKEILSWKKFIPNARIFIDCGANKGLYSECLMKHFQVDEIHLFEPSSLNYDILIDKFKEDLSVRINNFGLSNSVAKATLYSDSSGSGLASLTNRKLDHFNIKFDHKEKVHLKRFDQYWVENKNQIIDLFKIDVEGAELNVLEGLGNYVKKVKVVQFEFGGCNIDSKTYFQDFWYFFQKANFQVYRITPLGPFKITSYRESYERFQTTNYFCVNLDLVDI